MVWKYTISIWAAAPRFCFFCAYLAGIFLFMPASAPAEVSSVTVRSCWDVIPAFPDMLTGVRGGEAEKKRKKRVCEGQLKSKSYRRRCHVVLFCTFYPKTKTGFELLCWFIGSFSCLTLKGLILRTNAEYKGQKSFCVQLKMQFKWYFCTFLPIYLHYFMSYMKSYDLTDIKLIFLGSRGTFLGNLTISLHKKACKTHLNCLPCVHMSLKSSDKSHIHSWNHPNHIKHDLLFAFIILILNIITAL